MNTNDRFTALCREHGWKRTPQRYAVYRFMEGNLTHPQVDQVWDAVRKQIPAISRESVYRILNEFADAGTITRMDQIESARYDAQTQPHGHFICERCKRVIDFPLPELPELPPELPPEAIRCVELRVQGLCEACRKARQS